MSFKGREERERGMGEREGGRGVDEGNGYRERTKL
jgi:hypothetical protein